MNIHDFDYIYLHGFASSPSSSKAEFYRQQFATQGVKLQIPDLNGENFTHLTLSKALQQTQQLIDKCHKPIILIGSSMGGLISALAAENNSTVKKLILLAPAFKMSELWQRGVSAQQLNIWKTLETQPVYHYGYNKEVALHYQFYEDLFNYNDREFTRQLPCLIFHGIHDDVVPIKHSEEYVHSHTHAKLISLDDDHSVNKYLRRMWQLSLEFILTE